MQSLNLTAITDAILRKFSGVERHDILYADEVEAPAEREGLAGTATWVSFELKNPERATFFEGAACAWSSPSKEGPEIDLFVRNTSFETNTKPETASTTRF